MAELQRVKRQHILRQAEGYLELGMPRQALQAIARLGDRQSHSGHALYLHGEALRELRRYAEAVIPLVLCTRDNADHVPAWLALGWCYKRLGRLNDAIRSLEAGLVAEPEDALVNYNLACYWTLARHKDLALDYLAKSLSLKPELRELIDEETDFDAIRSEPEFQDVVEAKV